MYTSDQPARAVPCRYFILDHDRICVNNFNRALPALLLAAAAFSAHGADCDTGDNARRTVDSLTANIAGMKATQREHKAVVAADVDAITKKMVDEQRWTKRQAGQIYMEIMQSSTFSDLERKKMGAVEVYVEAARGFAAHMKKGDIPAACMQAKAMLFSQAAITGFNDKQYAYMLASAKKAAARSL
jgi:hypothetical protein